MMKLGIESYSYHRYFGEIYPSEADPGIEWSLTEFSKQMNLLPLEVVGLESCFLPTEDSEIAQAVQALNCPAVFAWGHPHGLRGLNEEDTLTQIGRYLRLSAQMGNRLLRIVVSSSAHFHEPHRPQMDMAIERLKKLLPVAAQLQVEVAVENHSDLYLDEIVEIIETINSPFLGLALDTGNALRRGEDPVAAASKFAPYLKITYVKDVRAMDGRLLCVPAGQGQTDLAGLFEVLANNNFSGPCMIELDAVHPDFKSRSETDLLSDSIHFLNTLRTPPR